MTKTTGITSAPGGTHTHIGAGASDLTGDIMSFPHNYDESRAQEVNFDSKTYKAGQENQQANSLYPSQEIQTFSKAKDLAEALCDMCVMEGLLEKKRRELALRADFNLCDTYKMFLQLRLNKPGIDCDDVFFTLKNNLEIDITIDEVFIIFYKVDKDSDGYWDYDELSCAFVPREKEYASLVTSRGGFYGSEQDVKNFFEP